jgi:hypothetical protein
LDKDRKIPIFPLQILQRVNQIRYAHNASVRAWPSVASGSAFLYTE